MTKPLSRTSQATWQKHIDAQAVSGLSQSDYCRANQLGIKYFSFWKSKLSKAAKPAVNPKVNPIGLIPVVVNATLSPPITSTAKASANPSLHIDMKLTFPNGVAMELRFPNETGLLPFIMQLIQLSC